MLIRVWKQTKSWMSGRTKSQCYLRVDYDANTSTYATNMYVFYALQKKHAQKTKQHKNANVVLFTEYVE